MDDTFHDTCNVIRKSHRYGHTYVNERPTAFRPMYATLEVGREMGNRDDGVEREKKREEGNRESERRMKGKKPGRA